MRTESRSWAFVRYDNDPDAEERRAIWRAHAERLRVVVISMDVEKSVSSFDGRSYEITRMRFSEPIPTPRS